MKLGIRLQSAGLPIPNTVSILKEVGLERSRKSTSKLRWPDQDSDFKQN